MQLYLPSVHPLFQSTFWQTDVAGKISPADIIRGNLVSTVDGMVATGVPPSVKLSIGMDAIAERLGKLEEAVQASGAGAVPAHMATLTEAVKETVKEQVAEWLRGLPASTTQQLPQQQLPQPVGFSLSSSAAAADPPLSVEEMAALAAAETRTLQMQYPLVTWGGKLHRVPEAVRFPRGIGTFQLMQQWHAPNESGGVPPLQLLSIEDFRFEDQKGGVSTEKAAKSYLSKAKTVVNSVLEEGCRLGHLPKSSGTYRNLSHQQQVAFVKGALESLYCRARQKKNSDKTANSNVLTLSFLTVADEIQCLRTKGKG